jgi:hypothetical protein
VLRSRVRRCTPLSFVRRIEHPTLPGPARRRPVRGGVALSPGCLPPVRSRPCDRAKPSAFPVTFARKPSHPFARSVRFVSSRRAAAPRYSVPSRFASRRPRWRGKDASGRPLQPTHDTSTRGSLDFRARVTSNVETFERVALTAGCFPDRNRVLPYGARPPCGNPTPAGRALDGAPPASADSHTNPSLHLPAGK